MGKDRPDAIIDTDVAEEMERSFLDYSYSVIYARALPDVRDGLKPVHRRILYGMYDLGLRPEKSHVKCSRAVGHVMGQFHPHGDSAIYEALVRMAQEWSMSVPLVDGHGNFGSPGGDDPPAAARYTECRMARAAVAMTAELDEATVDFTPTYDGAGKEPTVLPAAIPNLLVNGSEGIAVGMATKMPAHNLLEVVAGIRALIDNPELGPDELARIIPGPDFPTGGQIVGLDGVREAQATGRGAFRLRATAKIEDVSARRKGIVVTELPYAVGPEKVIEAIKDMIGAKKLAGVSNVVNLGDRKTGLRLVIEVKTGYHPAAVLEELYRTTPLEVTFGQHNLALVGGEPRTLSLLELCRSYLDHRLTVVRRRTQHRLDKAEARAHILEGLVVALANIDEVVRIIRAAKDAETARARLRRTFKLTELQAQAILDMTLRRLTGLEVTKLKDELKELRALISELRATLADPARIAGTVGDELAGVAEAYGVPRRTRLLDGAAVAAPAELQIPDDPCVVTVTSTGLVGRADPGAFKGTRGRHDLVVGTLATTKRSTVGAVTNAGRLLRLEVVEVPEVAGRSRGGPAREFLPDLGHTERVLALVPLTGPAGTGVALATRRGLVKRVLADAYPTRSGQEIIGLKDGDEVVGAAALAGDGYELVFVTSDAQLLRTAAADVRPQGKTGGGVAGIRLGEAAEVIAFGAVAAGDADRPDTVVVTATDGGSAKTSEFAQYPAKGRGTGGVRCHRFLKGETALAAAWVGTGPVLALSAAGEPVALPAEHTKRDASGSPLDSQPEAVGPARA